MSAACAEEYGYPMLSSYLSRTWNRPHLILAGNLVPYGGHYLLGSKNSITGGGDGNGARTPSGENAGCQCAQGTAGGRSTRIHGLAENRVLYAVAVVEGAAGTRSMDARPSDALALAAVTGALIHVEPAVLEAVKTLKQTSSEALPDTMEDASHIAADITARWPGYKVPRPTAPGAPAGGYPC